MLHHYHDRLRTSVLRIGRVRLTWTREPFAYSLYAFGRRLAWRPIDYARAPQ
jgi:hypothetical protein